eukprot:6074104-Amphidinium_carterae.1
MDSTSAAPGKDQKRDSGRLRLPRHSGLPDPIEGAGAQDVTQNGHTADKIFHKVFIRMASKSNQFVAEQQ